MLNTVYGRFNQEWEDLCAQGSIRIVPADTVLYYQGDAGRNLICLRKGTIRNYLLYSNGYEKTISVLEAPSITGETSVIDQGISINTCRSLTEIEISVVQSDVAKSFMTSNPRIMELMLFLYSQKIRFVQLQSEISILTNEHKLARMMVELIRNNIYCHPGECILRVTHQQLADLIGTTRPKVTMYLGQLEELNLIRRGRNAIEVLDPEVLYQLSISET